MNGGHFDSTVAIADSATTTYSADGNPSTIAPTLDTLAARMGWKEPGRGAFGAVIPPGARVLIKPNMVLHENEAPFGMDPLVTHASLIRAATDAALQASPSRVGIGDAPIQSCDFDQLLSRTGLREWSESLQRQTPRFTGIRDFRRTTCVVSHGVRTAAENLQPEDRFVLFDLGGDSLLEPITRPGNRFRVAWYDPRLMARTHRPGQHQYLIARDVLDADVVINLPKLKTHKKAGVTCALKNLIGINGNKEYLPHHRVGGQAAGGDCYPRKSAVKRTLEYIADQRNQTTSRLVASFWYAATLALTRILRVKGDRLGFEGSWSGNDTIWRTCLDLNRILLYGRADGTMADTPQRRIIHVVDAVVAGHADGPLAPKALPLGLLLGGNNAAAVDWVAAHVLGYDVNRIPIAREAFGAFKWPLARFAPAAIDLRGTSAVGLEELGAGAIAAGIEYPIGWRDAAASRASHHNAHAA